VARICQDHCPTADCDCLICHKHHKPERFETDLFTLPITHPYIIVRNGNPKAEAYLLERDSSSEDIHGSKDVLHSASIGPSSTGMLRGVPEEAGSSEVATQAYQRSRGTIRGRARNWRGLNAGCRCSARQPGSNNSSNDACGSSMQWRETNYRGQISVGTPRALNPRGEDSYREGKNLRRSLRSWRINGHSTSNHWGVENRNIDSADSR